MIENGLFIGSLVNGIVVKDGLVPIGRINRPEIEIIPMFLTVHNTANSAKGADANAHTNYIRNVDGKISWHFTVDEHNIVQHLPINEMGYHAGVSNGNLRSIGIEICENSDGDYSKAEENAISLIVCLLKELDMLTTNVKPHQYWSGKYCPRVILDSEEGWDGFLRRVELAMRKEWDDILYECLEQPEAWVKAIDSLKEMAELNSNLGDLEITKFIDSLIVKVFEYGREVGKKEFMKG